RRRHLVSCPYQDPGEGRPMAEGQSGPGDRSIGRQGWRDRYRGSAVRRPVDCPSNMIAKRLRDGRIAYYWNPHVRYIRAGFSLHREPLGQDYGTAIKRAAELNRHLDDWRRGRDTVKDLDLQPGFGTLDWLVQRYKNSNAWDEVSA